MGEQGRRLAAGMVCGVLAALAGSAVAAAATFTATGAEQAYVVPAGVTAVHVEAIGAPGGDGLPANSGTPGEGGRGGVVRADVPVSPGQVLYVAVGGPGASGGVLGPNPGGWNGGGASSNAGGAGGGASDVRTCSRSAASCPAGSSSLASRLIVAGGGGGGGSPSQGSFAGVSPGGGGGAAGADGEWGLTPPYPADMCGPGEGGSLDGPGTSALQNCNSAQAGRFGAGSDAFAGQTRGGGGGGGWFGGAGAAGKQGDVPGSGGGGGSSFISPAATNRSAGIAATETASVTITPLAPPEARVVTQATPGATVFVPVSGAVTPQPLATAQVCRRVRRVTRCTLTLRTSALGLPRSLTAARFDLTRGRRVVARGVASVAKGRVVLRGLRRRSGVHTLTIRTGRGKASSVRARRAIVLG